jgi:hypothetical protein
MKEVIYWYPTSGKRLSRREPNLTEMRISPGPARFLIVFNLYFSIRYRATHRQRVAAAARPLAERASLRPIEAYR